MSELGLGLATDCTRCGKRDRCDKSKNGFVLGGHAVNTKKPYCVIECPERKDFENIKKAVDFFENHRWIPVSERMPDMDIYEIVLVCATCKVKENIRYNNAIVMAYVWEEGFKDVEFDVFLTGVTHWMPLPEPPEEEEI